MGSVGGNCTDWRANCTVCPETVDLGLKLRARLHSFGQVLYSEGYNARRAPR